MLRWPLYPSLLHSIPVFGDIPLPVYQFIIAAWLRYASFSKSSMLDGDSAKSCMQFVPYMIAEIGVLKERLRDF
jgi:hypothetical protein